MWTVPFSMVGKGGGLSANTSSQWAMAGDVAQPNLNILRNFFQKFKILTKLFVFWLWTEYFLTLI